MKRRCTCGGFDENFEVLNEENIGECGICGLLVCECGLDEQGHLHSHSWEALQTLDGAWDY
jgi:hypothetical protein